MAKKKEIRGHGKAIKRGVTAFAAVLIVAVVFLMSLNFSNPENIEQKASLVSQVSTELGGGVPNDLDLVKKLGDDIEQSVFFHPSGTIPYPSSFVKVPPPSKLKEEKKETALPEPTKDSKWKDGDRITILGSDNYGTIVEKKDGKWKLTVDGKWATDDDVDKLIQENKALSVGHKGTKTTQIGKVEKTGGGRHQMPAPTFIVMDDDSDRKVTDYSICLWKNSDDICSYWFKDENNKKDFDAYMEKNFPDPKEDSATTGESSKKTTTTDAKKDGSVPDIKTAKKPTPKSMIPDNIKDKNPVKKTITIGGVEKTVYTTNDGKVHDDEGKEITTLEADAQGNIKPKAGYELASDKPNGFTTKPIINYGNIDKDGDFEVNVGETKYFIRPGALFSDDDIYITDPNSKTGKSKCSKCTILEEDGNYFIVDNRNPGNPKKFRLNKDPDVARDDHEAYCYDHPDDKKCTGYVANRNAVFEMMENKFSNRIEGIFDSLFERFFPQFFSEFEYKFYNSVCKIDYYKSGTREIPFIASYDFTLPTYALDLEPYERKIIVQLSGSKEQITNTTYRYSFTAKLIGKMHYMLYLYNDCTKQVSFTMENETRLVPVPSADKADANTGAANTGTPANVNSPDAETGTAAATPQETVEQTLTIVNGFMEEGQQAGSKVNIMHIADDRMTFDCAVKKDIPCRYNNVCIKLFDDDRYPDPLCVGLVDGSAFFTKGEDIGNKGSMVC